MKSSIFFHLSTFVCMNPASLQSFLLTTFFSSFFILWSIRTFLHYYCENTYDSCSWSAREDYLCAMQTQNKNQSCLKRFQCQARCEQRSRYKVIACRQMNSMKSQSIFVRSTLLVLLGFVSLIGLYCKQLARRIR